MIPNLHPSRTIIPIVSTHLNPKKMNTPNRNNDLQEMAHSFAETRQSYEEGFLRSTMPLESLLEQREQELLKAIEYGQNLLNRVRELEGEMHRDGEEKELVLEENEALRLRVENLEEVRCSTLMFY